MTWYKCSTICFFACGGPLSVLLLHSSFPFVRLFRSYFVPLFLSSDFSVPLLFLFSALQTFPFLFVPLFRSSDFSARISFLFSVLLSARHFLDGGVFRSIGIFFFYLFIYFVVYQSVYSKTVNNRMGGLITSRGRSWWSWC